MHVVGENFKSGEVARIFYYSQLSFLDFGPRFEQICVETWIFWYLLLKYRPIRCLR